MRVKSLAVLHALRGFKDFLLIAIGVLLYGAKYGNKIGSFIFIQRFDVRNAKAFAQHNLSVLLL